MPSGPLGHATTGEALAAAVPAGPLAAAAPGAATVLPGAVACGGASHRGAATGRSIQLLHKRRRAAEKERGSATSESAPLLITTEPRFPDAREQRQTLVSCTSSPSAFLALVQRLRLAIACAPDGASSSFSAFAASELSELSWLSFLPFPQKAAGVAELSTMLSGRRC